MQLTETGVAIFYGLVGLSAVGFLFWLGATIITLIRTPDEPPAD